MAPRSTLRQNDSDFMFLSIYPMHMKGPVKDCQYTVKHDILATVKFSELQAL